VRNDGLSTTLLYICISVHCTIFLHEKFKKFILLFFLWCCDPTWFTASSFTRFLDHTQLDTTVDRTPLDEWSASRRDLYLTTYNSHNRQTSISPVLFEFTLQVKKRPRIHALDRTVTGICNFIHMSCSILTYPLWLWTWQLTTYKTSIFTSLHSIWH